MSMRNSLYSNGNVTCGMMRNGERREKREYMRVWLEIKGSDAAGMTKEQADPMA